MKRRLYAGKDVQRALSIADLRKMARRRLPHFAFEYIDGGAEDERTLAWNRRVFESIRFVPPMLIDASERSLRTRLFDRDAEAPLVVAPTGLNGLAHHRGDVALARAAAAAGVPFTLSTVSNVRLEAVAREAGGRLWMQLYLFQNRDITRDIVARAERTGYEALVLTTDANLFGRREWDGRNYRAPGRLSARNLVDAALHPRWLLEVIAAGGVPRFENIADFLPPEARSASGGVTIFPSLFSQDICWEDVARLRDMWPRKLMLKGILSVDDAVRAADLGCDAIVVSNHGGRQLDTCVSPMDVLAEMRRTLGNRLALIVDSGFRRGTDIVKALALGADAVMIGRATLYGLAAGGETGVRRALAMLTDETRLVLGQLGCRSPGELGPHLLRMERNAR